jgi:transposase
LKIHNCFIFKGKSLMSFQGKQLSAEITELVVRLKEYHDEERKACKFVPTKDPAGRTAQALGLGVATVKRIMARYAQSGGEVVVRVPQRPGRPPSGISQNIQPIVRQFIRTENLGGRRVSIERVGSYLHSVHGVETPKTTLWRALKRWGFTHGEGRRRDSLKEQSRVILARRDYLRAKLANRNSDGTLKLPEVYLDETYINKNHSSPFTWYLDDDGPLVNKPSGVGPRLIVVHAVTKDGWVDGAQLVFEAKKRTGDYHGQMNWDNFSKWFKGQLLPNIAPKSVIILDNARYHNVYSDSFFPNKSSSKEQLRRWLTRNSHPWREDMLKSELMELCTRFAPVPEYQLDILAAEHKMSILRTPPYHPELQPIETCWAVVKNYMADNCDFTMKGLRERLPKGFAKVTSRTCQKIITEVVEQEDNYWTEDEKLDEVYAANAEEEYKGQSLCKALGAESYLEEL